MTVTPAANQNGTATITVTRERRVVDARVTLSCSRSPPVNDAPTISEHRRPDDQRKTRQRVRLRFTVGDVETAAGSLTVSGTSSNTTLVPNANIVFGGSGANRTVTVTPAANQTGHGDDHGNGERRSADGQRHVCADGQHVWLRERRPSRNTAAITIPTCGSTATPYPSGINVTGWAARSPRQR